MKSSRLFTIILSTAFVIVALVVIVRWISNRNALEVTPLSSNVEYTQWQLPKGAKTRLGKGSINDIKFSPDGKRFAVSTSIGVWVYDVQTGEEISLLKGDRQDVKGIAFPSDGSMLTGVNSSGGILRWNVLDGELHSIIKNEKAKPLGSAIFSEDSTKLIRVGRPYPEIQIWDINEKATSPIVKDIEHNSKKGILTAIALSPDKRLLATAKNEYN
ncbi:WD40 repeat domain-containing protein [Candidatus Poribacteria bacterium]|nr:WD40 repeat domain-containing protein [Candidatus Poribacteria bacterium]